MKVVLGLGNPGESYRGHRHNIGFRVVDLLAERCRVGLDSRGEVGRKAWVARGNIGGEDVLLAQPRTYMNRSGSAALAVARRAGAGPSDIVVVFDDADLELGRVRVRPDGGAGGHNGIRSLLEVLGSPAFPRVKLGVKGHGRPDGELADYVLSDFTLEERPTVERMVEIGADAVEWLLREGVESAMREFNGRSPA